MVYDLRIAVILGSTRPGRKGEAVARWVISEANGRRARYELVDLADYPLPHFDALVPPAAGGQGNPQTREWAAKIGEFDGFVFVTPEYNHSTSGVLKNAIDYVFDEWADTAAALAGYGTLGGTRAVEHLRGILSALQIAHVQAQLSFSMYNDFVDWDVFAPGPEHLEQVQVMFDQLEGWSAALKPLRDAKRTTARDPRIETVQVVTSPM